LVPSRALIDGACHWDSFSLLNETSATAGFVIVLRNVAIQRVERAGVLPYLEGMKYVFIFIACALSAAGVARADDFVGTFGDWHVQAYIEGGGKVCLMWGSPTKSQGKYTRRGDVYTYVTQRSSKKRLNEVSISIGYPFKKESALSILIGKSNFSMFTDGDTAWNAKRKDDVRMVKAMRAGATMTARGVSQRGTKTKDVFSLKGFTKAYAEMNKACGIK
jgi:hypothetical protein